MEPRRTSRRALVAVIPAEALASAREAWIGGVSTRRVDDLVQAMGLAGLSESTASKPCKDIDGRVHAVLDRPLSGDWPYLWLDATDLKQRKGGRIVTTVERPVAAKPTPESHQLDGHYPHAHRNLLRPGVATAICVHQVGRPHPGLCNSALQRCNSQSAGTLH